MSIIPDLYVLTPKPLRPARGRVRKHLSVLDQAIPAHVFVFLRRPLFPVPLWFVGRPQLLTRREPFPAGEACACPHREPLSTGRGGSAGLRCYNRRHLQRGSKPGGDSRRGTGYRQSRGVARRPRHGWCGHLDTRRHEYFKQGRRSCGSWLYRGRRQSADGPEHRGKSPRVICRE